MKITELRIGNWVGYLHLEKKEDNEIQVNSFIKISSVGIQRGHSFVTLDGREHFGVDISAIQPIPLTPEILEKAGFELNTGDGCYYIYEDDNNIHFEFDVESKEVWIGGFNSSSTMEHIKYVHQLQNLVHILTGTELEINLNP